MKITVILNTDDGSMDAQIDGEDIVGLSSIGFNQSCIKKDAYNFNAYRTITDDSGVQKTECWNYSVPDMNMSHTIEDTQNTKTQKAVNEFFSKKAK